MNIMDDKYLEPEERFVKIFLHNSTDVTINTPKIKKVLFEVYIQIKLSMKKI